MPVTAATPSRTTRRRRLTLLGLAAGLSLTQLPACAIEPSGRTQPVAISVVDRDSGRLLALYHKDGRAFVAGRPGARYAIRVANQTGERVLIVLSVDGVNVLTGQTAAWGQTGYVLDPGRRYDITGWRKSDTAIAAFEFAALSDSYAARTGRPDNVGVIGMAVFLERPAAAPQVAAGGRSDSAHEAGTAPGTVPPGAGRNAAAATKAAAPRADGAMAAEAGAAAPARLARDSERLGTAHGQREWSLASRTTFERLSVTPQAVVEIAYDSFANLVAAGVIARPIARVRPFPLSDDEAGFVPDPPLR